MPDDLTPRFAPPPTLYLPGESLVSTGVYRYACPLCHREFRYDDPYEPICTGPGWRDSHPPEVMRRLETVAPRAVIQIP
jgi:hypothetical protein